MSDIFIRITGQAGRITLTRPRALNALTYDMAMQIDTALKDWAQNEAVKLVIIDAEGPKAFCAGGDIQEIYERGRAGDVAFAQRFWRDEYRLNARIAEYPKPYLAFMQGFTMGGGVGISCHGSHRIVGETSQIAMPEVGIGLVPDVGGSLLLARAPGRMGEYLATTATRMGTADALLAGFADCFVPEAKWPDLIADLEAEADLGAIDRATEPPPRGLVRARAAEVDALFGGETLRDILNALNADQGAFARETCATLTRHSPLSMACAIEMIHRLRGPAADIRRALDLEYRFTFRAMEHGDFLEGIRAAVIDKDRRPVWRHALDDPPALVATKMLMPLGTAKLTFDEEGETT